MNICDIINHPLFAEADAGIYPHTASQYHAWPKAKRGIAMLSMDKVPYPHQQTRGSKFIPCSMNVCPILKRFCSFYTPVWKTGRIMPWQCPSVRLSVRLSVRPSVRVFRTFLQHALRYQFETWYIHSVGGTTCQVWVASQLGHFDLVYSQK